MASASGHKSRPHSKYCTSYNEYLRNLKDSILQDGTLSGADLQRCLLINGVPVEDCPTSDQLFQRLGLPPLPHEVADADIGTLGRIKRRSSFRIKRRKSKKQSEDALPIYDNSQERRDFLIMQLLHSCCQLMSLEAINQTPVLAPLSPNRVPGDEAETSLQVEKIQKGETSIVNRKDSRDGGKKQSITYDSIDLEFCYMETRERTFLTEEVDNTLEPLEDATSYFSDGTNREPILLRDENQLLRRKLNKSESYAEHLESKCDELYAKLGTCQAQLSKLTNQQSDSESIPGMG